MPIVAGTHPTHVPFPGGEYIFLTLTVYISLAGGTWEVSGRLAGKRARRCLFITQRHASRSRVRMPKIARQQSSHPKPVAGRAPVLPSGTLLFSPCAVAFLPPQRDQPAVLAVDSTHCSTTLPPPQEQQSVCANSRQYDRNNVRFKSKKREEPLLPLKHLGIEAPLRVRRQESSLK